VEHTSGECVGVWVWVRVFIDVREREGEREREQIGTLAQVHLANPVMLKSPCRREHWQELVLLLHSRC
jgi:hypothetical protein